MVCDKLNIISKALNLDVLILILLEYGLRPYFYGNKQDLENVLILILLEYGLRPYEEVVAKLAPLVS